MKHTSLKSIPLTHVQAARYLGISRPVLARLADTGKIPYTTGSQGTRRYRVYRVDDLKAYRDAVPVPKSPPPPPTTPPDGYVDTQTAATLMGISTSGVSKAFAAGRLPNSIKPGKFRFYAKTDIDRFVKVPSDQGFLDLKPSLIEGEETQIVSELRELNTNIHEMLTLARGQNALLTMLVEKWS